VIERFCSATADRNPQSTIAIDSMPFGDQFQPFCRTRMIAFRKTRTALNVKMWSVEASVADRGEKSLWRRRDADQRRFGPGSAPRLGGDAAEYMRDCVTRPSASARPPGTEISTNA